jgi:hypothetical protein
VHESLVGTKQTSAKSELRPLSVAKRTLAAEIKTPVDVNNKCAGCRAQPHPFVFNVFGPLAQLRTLSVLRLYPNGMN